MSTTNNSSGSILELSHSIKLYNKKRICVCNGHCCDLYGISEYEYLKRKRAYDLFKKQKGDSV